MKHSCTNCRHPVEFSESQAGKSYICPKCKTKNRLVGKSTHRLVTPHFGMIVLASVLFVLTIGVTGMLIQTGAKTDRFKATKALKTPGVKAQKKQLKVSETVAAPMADIRPSGSGEEPIVEKFNKPTDKKTFDRETLLMFGATWCDGYTDPTWELDFFDRGLQVKEKHAGTRMIRIDWQDPESVHNVVYLHDSETLIFNFGTGEAILKPWKYWLKLYDHR